MPETEEGTRTEWETFANIREALEDEREQELAETKAAVREVYRAALTEALAPLDTASVLPDPSYQSRHSDPTGLLARIAETQDPNPQFVIVVTDMIDTGHEKLPTIASPKGDTRALLLHVPATDADILQTAGQTLSGREQFERTGREVQDAAPWLVVEPHFTRSLAALLASAGE